jgi:hypothetical protein
VSTYERIARCRVEVSGVMVLHRLTGTGSLGAHRRKLSRARAGHQVRHCKASRKNGEWLLNESQLGPVILGVALVLAGD